MIKIFSALLAVVIHVGVAFMLLWHPTQLQKPPPTGGEVEYTFHEPHLLESSSLGMSCPKTYKGIGVLVNYGSLRVTQVVKGGPADKAGVLIDDIIMDDYFGLYPIGAEINVEVIRDGKPLKLKAIIGDICYE